MERGRGNDVLAGEQCGVDADAPPPLFPHSGQAEDVVRRPTSRDQRASPLSSCRPRLFPLQSGRRNSRTLSPLSFQELTYIIKQDIAHLNQQIAQLQAFTRSNLNSANGSKQVSEHNNNVVMMLQSKLADASIGFKDVLEIRTQVRPASVGLWRETEELTLASTSRT